MYSLPALPNSCAAPGEFVIPRVSIIIFVVVLVGDSLSGKNPFKLPENIFSKPTTITQSAVPEVTIFLAMANPVEPVEQLLLTL